MNKRKNKKDEDGRNRTADLLVAQTNSQVL